MTPAQQCSVPVPESAGARRIIARCWKSDRRSLPRGHAEQPYGPADAGVPARGSAQVYPISIHASASLGIYYQPVRNATRPRHRSVSRANVSAYHCRQEVPPDRRGVSRLLNRLIYQFTLDPNR